MLNLAPLTAQPGHGGAKHHDLAPVTIGRNLMVTQKGRRFRENTIVFLMLLGIAIVCVSEHSQSNRVGSPSVCVCVCLHAVMVYFHTNFLKRHIVSPGQF